MKIKFYVNKKLKKNINEQTISGIVKKKLVNRLSWWKFVM